MIFLDFEIDEYNENCYILYSKGLKRIGPMVMDRTEIEALAKDCGLYIVEGRHTLGLALEHKSMKIYSDSWFRYCDRKDIVVKFSEEQLGNGKYTGKFELQDLFPSAMIDTINYRHQKRRKPIIYGDTAGIIGSIDRGEYLAPELIIKAIVTNLKLRLDDLMKGGLLSKKKKHMKEIAECSEGFEV